MPTINGRVVRSNAQITSNVMRKFDFDSVHKHMVKTRWVWGMMDGKLGVPTIEDLKNTARRLINNVLQDDNREFATTGWSMISTGGFEVIRNTEGVELRFVPWTSAFYLD